MEVLALVAKGYTNKAIAVQLGISDRTVQNHLANTFQKLNAESRNAGSRIRTVAGSSLSTQHFQLSTINH